MTAFDLAGVAGAALILAGYAAATAGRFDTKGAVSLAINLLGAALILVSLLRAFNLAAAIVEAAWAAIALAGLVRLAARRLRSRAQ